MKAFKSFKKLTLKAFLSLVGGTALLAYGSGCNENQAYEMGDSMAPGIAKLLSPFRSHIFDAAVDNTEVKVEVRQRAQLAMFSDLRPINLSTQ